MVEAKTDFVIRDFIFSFTGNVAENVILDRESESTVMFMEGAQRAYLGYVTIKFSPPSCTDTMQHHKSYALDIQENCSPTIEHCIIRSCSHCKYLMWNNIGLSMNWIVCLYTLQGNEILNIQRMKIV